MPSGAGFAITQLFADDTFFSNQIGIFHSSVEIRLNNVVVLRTHVFPKSDLGGHIDINPPLIVRPGDELRIGTGDALASYLTNRLFLNGYILTAADFGL